MSLPITRTSSVLTVGLSALYVMAGCAREPDDPNESPEHRIPEHSTPEITTPENVLVPSDPPVSDCCSSDTHCTPELPRCVAGICSNAPRGVACWTTTDCEIGELCEGASICPCGAPCLVSSPGVCVVDPCHTLDYCACIAERACRAVTEPCFCPCWAYECFPRCDCICGGGEYLRCESR
jgi:hypothetical protein